MCPAIEWTVPQPYPRLDVLAYRRGQTPLPPELLTQTRGGEVHTRTIAALHPEPPLGVEDMAVLQSAQGGVRPRQQAGLTEKHSVL